MEIFAGDYLRHLVLWMWRTTESSPTENEDTQWTNNTARTDAHTRTHRRARTHAHGQTDAHARTHTRTRTNRRTHTHATSTLRNTQSNSYIEDIIRWRRDKDFIILENSILRVRRTDVLPTRRSDAMFFLIMWMGVFYLDQKQFLESTCHYIWDLTVTYLPYVTSLRH